MAFPFSRIVHEPQTPIPQPHFVPVRLRVSRRTQTRGVSSSTLTVFLAPLMVRWISLIRGYDGELNQFVRSIRGAVLRNCCMDHPRNCEASIFLNSNLARVVLALHYDKTH